MDNCMLRYADAEYYYRRALDGFHSTLGPDHHAPRAAVLVRMEHFSIFEKAHPTYDHELRLLHKPA